jgi:hypothetical protein
MHQIDEMKLVTDLEPATITTMAEDGYVRRRDRDLARIFTLTDHSVRLAPRRRWVKPLTTGLTATAATAAALAVVLAQAPAPRPVTHARAGTHPGAATPAVAAPVSARGFLLTSAVQAAHTPAVSGTYWFIRTRDYTAAEAIPKESETDSTPTKKKLLPKHRVDFGAQLAYSEDSWMGRDRARTITNEDVEITFATPADEAAWKAAGSPPLMTAYGTSRQPVTSDYHMSFHWGDGSAQFTWDDLQNLRTSAQLDTALRQMWDRESDKFDQFGTTSYSEYIFEWTGQLLTAPVQPAIRAAIYQLLAAQPGLINVGAVTVPDGRSGTGIAMPGGAGDFLIIDPATAQAIAWGTGTLHQGETITPSSVSGLEEYQTMGWTSQLGG